jgi:hypothetical protein
MDGSTVDFDNDSPLDLAISHLIHLPITKARTRSPDQKSWFDLMHQLSMAVTRASG